MGAMKGGRYDRRMFNEALVNRFGYDPYYTGRMVAYDSSEFERLVSHFGYEEAMRMLQEYGDEAFNFLPNLGFGKSMLYTEGFKTNRVDPQHISHYCDYIENTVDWNPFKTIGKIAKGAFKVVTFVPRTIVKGAVAGGKAVVKGTGKVIQVAGNVIKKAPYILLAPVLVPLAVSKIIAHKNKTGKKLIPKSEAMRVVANDSEFQNRAAQGGVKSMVEAGQWDYSIQEEEKGQEQKVGFPVMAVLSVVTLLWPLIVKLLAKKEANPNRTPEELYNESLRDPEFQQMVANLEAQANEPLEEVSGGSWFSKNWWIVALAGGGVVLVTTLILVSSRSRVGVGVDKLVKGSPEARRYMARLRALRGKGKRGRGKRRSR